MITISFLNADGTGFASRYTVPAETTVADFLKQRNVNPNDVQIRLKRVGQDKTTPAADDELQNGDIMSAVPSKGVGFD